MRELHSYAQRRQNVSVLFNEPKLLKSVIDFRTDSTLTVSVLFNEPKLLKWMLVEAALVKRQSFSALQRAEIAEIAERYAHRQRWNTKVSVLFNEPKLLKSVAAATPSATCTPFQCSSTSRNC